jgi:hypothetical protein
MREERAFFYCRENIEELCHKFVFKLTNLLHTGFFFFFFGFGGGGWGGWSLWEIKAVRYYL